ncbi:heme ABC exporter ATP-binding protein CcmA [Oleisolibacter albus]|uniref:heme ABC exporter ATP-binding protein CcmA n=1 Tax=Oleisolibacter albus TaxID=2171757 RepID=UPI000DF2DA3C|nr:heme ABC exporter ATP-binding protein CcmA [Oleisolibacter albus]
MPRFEGRDLTCLRSTRVVFAGLDFAVDTGAALVLVGPNGSGKSSLLRLMAGLSRPFAGQFLWDGAAIADEPDVHRARLRYVGHLDAVKPALSVLENLTAWAALDGGADPRGRALAALERFALDHLADVPGRYLSAGQKRRLNLSRLALAAAPLWLLDEPTTALDRASVARLAAEIRRHRASGGMVVLSTHTDLDLEAPAVLDVSDFAVQPAPGEVLL